MWEALLERMPLTAMIRNLGVMTGWVLAPGSDAARKAVDASVGPRGATRRARVHPVAVLAALKTYAQGVG